MIFFCAWLVTASSVLAIASDLAVRKPSVQIDATGSVRDVHSSLVAVQAYDDNSERLLRHEVRRHRQDEPEKIEAEQLDERSCPVAHGAAGDSPSHKLCRILTGSNSQVAGKLERAVKGLSLRPQSANATQYVVADKKEEKQLSNLKAALWDLWFCAKRADPPCDPLMSQDHKVEVARQQAFTALELIYSHPEAGMSTSLSPGSAADSDRLDHIAGGSVMPASEEAIPSMSPIGWSTVHSHRRESLSSLLQADSSQVAAVGNTSGFAEDVLTSLLHGDDKTVIQKRLWNAINKMDIQKVLENDIVKIEDDADGNYKALEANLLLLHECATMPECPATNCCNPKSPEQAKYKDARNAAYQAYHNIQHDDSLAKQTYLDLLSTVASGKHKDYYPPKHPLYVPTTEEPETTTEEAAENATVSANGTHVSKHAPPIEEGSMLIIAICMVTGVVIIAIAYLLHKTNQMDHDKGDYGHGYESWGGEGEYGNY